MSRDAHKGDWVQILQVILEPGQRASQVPNDTSRLPLNCFIKGFLVDDADLGDAVTITTVIGRQVKGKLVAVNPGYNHSFGVPHPAFTEIGSELRRILENAS